MMFNKHDDIMGKFTAELKVAKLLQTINDKDQELFEAQETVAELLGALEDMLRIHTGDMYDAGFKPPTCHCGLCNNARKAIRKASM